ncbi:MAG: hypothetical protein ABIR48_05005, partial [Gammaproteobacteria bacterium]
LRITGVKRIITMQEIEPGIYEAEYTIKRKDRLTANTTVRASLRRGTRVATAKLSQPLMIANAVATSKPALPVIEQFRLVSAQELTPGTELRFTLKGTPNAKAGFTIEGVAENLPLTETPAGSGTYEGRYTIRRNDNLAADANITATLALGDQSARTRLDQASKDKDPPLIKNQRPFDGDTVSSSTPVIISATLDDGNGSGVDPRSVRIMLNDLDVTRDSSITATTIKYQVPQSQERRNYSVEIFAKDLNGNFTRATWSFEAQAGETANRRLPLDIFSPANNSEVSGDRIEVRGRSAPNTSIDVQVDASTALVGSFGFKQNILRKTLQTDAGGYFEFAFEPPLKQSGTRYDAKIKARNADQTQEQNLVLFQR